MIEGLRKSQLPKQQKNPESLLTKKTFSMALAKPGTIKKLTPQNSIGFHNVL